MPPFSRRLAVAALSVIALLLPCSALAQAPQGHIAYVYPAGGQRGASLEATVSGIDLDEAKGVRVSGEGVTGEIVKVEKGKTATIALHIAPDAPLGQRDLRLVTSGGVTNRARFIVGQLPEVLEKEPNSDLPSAQALPALPVVVNGQALQADKDLFRFSAQAGQTIVCRVQAQELLPFIADGVPGWFQAVLSLYDANGKVVAYADDFHGHPDPVLIYQVPRDGEYRVEIRDALYRGREDFVYRLSLGTLPYITHIYPLGGRQQGTAKVDLFGVNLPSRTLEVELPADGPPLRYLDCGDPAAASNALPFAVGQGSEAQESEPNNTLKEANEIEWPVTVNGRIAKPGDVDYFVFSAEAKQQLVMEVFARRLDSPLDSILTLLDAEGRMLAQNDDTEDECAPQITHHADSRLVFTCKTSGKYYLKLADVQGKGGDDFAYRLAIAPPQPDFRLRVLPDNPRVGQGASTVLSVRAVRRDGFNGAIDLSVENLPEGFSASGAVIPEGSNEAILSLTSPGAAGLDICTPTILGTATIAGKTVTRRAAAVEDVMQAFYFHHLLPTEEFLLSVVEPGPFKLLTLLPPEGFIRFGGGRTAFLDVKVERTPQAKGPVRLALYNPPKGVRMVAATIGADQEQAKVEIAYPNQLSNDVRFNLVISGSMKVGAKNATTLSPVIVALGPGAKAPAPPKPATPSPSSN